MKQTVLWVVFVLFGLQSYAQTSSVDSRLLSLYSQEQIDEMQNSQADILEYWSFYLDNGYMLVDYDEKRYGNLTKEISISDDLNLLALNIYPTSETQHFADRVHNKVLILLPKEKLISKYNSYKAEKLD